MSMRRGCKAHASNMPRHAYATAQRLKTAAQADVEVVVDLSVPGRIDTVARRIDLEHAKAHEHVGAVPQPRHEPHVHVRDVVGLAERYDVRCVEQAERDGRVATRAQEILRFAAEANRKDILV